MEDTVFSEKFGEYLSDLADLITFIRVNTFAMDKIYFEDDEWIEKTPILVDFIENEMKSGQSFLYKSMTIRLYGIIESLIDAILIDSLNETATREMEQIRRLKGSVIDFSKLTLEEQSEYLLDLLKFELKLNTKQGVGKFETLLDCVGIGGGVNEVIRKNLLELSQIRNVIVHKNSRVDKRLLENCPWLDSNVGEKINITWREYLRYSRSVDWYVLEISSRMEMKSSQQVPDWIKHEQALIISALLEQQKQIEENK